MRNKIVGGLLVLTGVVFTVALFVPNSDNPQESIATAFRLYGFGVITGISAVMTRLLIKENT